MVQGGAGFLPAFGAGFCPAPPKIHRNLQILMDFREISRNSGKILAEVHSIVNSNFGAVQDVAQPDAQLADQYFAQPESSP